MKKICAGVAVIAISAMLAGTALAAPGGGRGRGQGWGGPGACWQGAQTLSAEDQAKFQESRAKFMTDTLELRKAMATKHVELRTLYAQPTPDQAKIKALNNELIDIRAQLDKKRNEYMGQYGAFCGGPGWGRGWHRGPGYGMGPGYGRGPGMMGPGYGPGMMGPGWGAGPGYGAQSPEAPSAD